MATATIPVGLLIGLFVMALFAMFTAFFTGRLTKKGIKGRKGDVLFIGHRPSTGKIFLRHGKPTRGVFAWKEPGDFEADIVFDEGMMRTPTSPRFGGNKDREDDEVKQILAADKYRQGHPSVVEVDLDLYQAISYEGHCRNDRTATVVYEGGKTEDVPLDKADEFENMPNVKKVIREVWRRLPGTRLNAVRKGRDIEKMNEPGDDWVRFGLKALPVFMIFGTLLLIIILGVGVAVLVG